MWNHEQFGVWSLAWKPESILALLAGVWIGAPSVSTWCSLSVGSGTPRRPPLFRRPLAGPRTGSVG